MRGSGYTIFQQKLKSNTSNMLQSHDSNYEVLYQRYLENIRRDIASMYKIELSENIFSRSSVETRQYDLEI